MKKAATEIQGYEYDWLARDRSGYVAVLSTAGGGLAPPAFLENTDAHQSAIEAIEMLAVRTQVLNASEPNVEKIHPWGAMILRGLFAFDASAHGGPYRLVGSPADPVSVWELPSSIRTVVERIQLFNVQFHATSEISGERLSKGLRSWRGRT